MRSDHESQYDGIERTFEDKWGSEEVIKTKQTGVELDKSELKGIVFTRKDGSKEFVKAIPGRESGNPKVRLEKYKVCDQCFSVGMIYADCICSYSKYKTIELEFEVCNCCDRIINDGEPADTEFNTKQIESLNRK